MLSKVLDKFEAYENKKIDSIGLDILRITYFTVFLGEVLHFYYFQDLMVETFSKIQVAAVSAQIIYPLWILVIIALIFGYCNKALLVLNYVFTVIFFSLTKEFSYHMFYSYTSINLFLIFTPLGNNLTIKNVITKKPDTKVVHVPVFYYHFLVFWGVAIVYFDSIFRKFGSPMWSNGLGMWMPASIPYMTWLDLDPILNNEWLVKFCGYLTLYFETIMIFIFWFKRFRLPVFLIGIGLHLGILIAFPIPFFALGVCAIYLLLLPTRWWRIIFSSSSSEVEYVDLSKRSFKLFMIAFAIALFFQSYHIYKTPLIQSVAPHLSPKIDKKVKKVAGTFGTLTGIVVHGVFMDLHFQRYNHIIGVVANIDDKETWLPMINEDGSPGLYSIGFGFVNWTFRSISPDLKKDQMEKGIARYTKFWALKNNIDPDKVEFRIKVKKIDIPVGWEHDFLSKQRKAPWVDAGKLTFQNLSPNFEIVDIEKI